MTIVDHFEGKWNRLGNSSGSFAYLKNSFALFLEKGIKLLAELAVGFYLARYLGTEQFGLYNFAISFVILFQGISTFGMAEILTKEIISNPDAQRKILGTAFVFRLMGSTILTFIILLLSIIFYGREVTMIVGIISLSLIFRAGEVFTFYFQSIVRLDRVALIQIVVTVIFSGIKLLLISIDASLHVFAAVYSIEWAMILIGFFFILKPYIKLSSLSFSLGWSMRLLRDSWFLMASAVAVNLYMRMDQIMIKSMLGNVENGIYASAVRISEVWYVVPTILCSVFFSAILNAKKISNVLYEGRYLKLNAFLFWFSMIIGFAISPFATEIISFFYGVPFQDAGPVLSLHIWTAPFVFWGVCSGYWLIAEGLQFFSLIRTLIGLLINLVFNLVLIPTYGVWGASLATLLGQIGASILSMLIFEKTRDSLKIQLKSVILPLIFIFQQLKSLLIRS